MVASCRALLLSCALFARQAYAAEPIAAQARARTLSAQPDAPSSAVFYRAQMHGKVGVRLPLFGGDRGWSLHVPTMLELHNAERRFIPSQHWRGRVAFELTHRRAPSAGFAVAHSVLLEHESDHVSGPPGGFLHKNGFAFRQDLTWLLGPHALTFTSMPRFHLYSCTIAAPICAPGEEKLTGSVAFEPVFELIFEGSWGALTRHRLRPFLAFAASWLLPHAKVAQERRLTFELGVGWSRPRAGVWQLFLTSMVGNELGYLREREGLQLGAGVRWALR